MITDDNLNLLQHREAYHAHQTFLAISEQCLKHQLKIMAFHQKTRFFFSCVNPRSLHVILAEDGKEWYGNITTESFLYLVVHMLGASINLYPLRLETVKEKSFN